MAKPAWPPHLPAPLVTVEPSFPGLSFEERRAFGALIPELGQAEVMRRFGLFEQVILRQRATADEMIKGHQGQSLKVAVFNMERGQTLAETLDFAAQHPQFKNFDIILANELDDGCERSYNCDVSATFANALKMHDAYALEFVELVNPADRKGYHGNSIFSRFPIKQAQVIRLPEECNWYYDAKQHRIGGRNAILAIIETPHAEVAVVSTHFENRTDSAGRGRQMQAILDAVTGFVPPQMPLILGGDFNTNGYDGRDYQAAAAMLARQKAGASLESFYSSENTFSIADQAGFEWRSAAAPEWPTRRAHFTEEVYDDSSRETLVLHIDWLFSKGLKILDKGMISTVLADHIFMQNPIHAELSDHNIVWAEYALT